MRELDDLRELTARIRRPSTEALVATARRRRRRAATLGTAVAALVALLAGGTVVMTGYDDRSAPPAHQPAPGPMTPEGIVNGESSRLVTAAVSIDDPDARIALWEADCPRCGAVDGPAYTVSALALTTDGFGSATYVRAPDSADSKAQIGVRTPARIESLADDLFLVVDTDTPGEWLVRADGTMRRVERVATRLAPTDPRLWFRCHPADEPSSWDNAAPPSHPPEHSPWCALDPDSATAYEWPARWRGSVALPVSGEEPWGVDVRWQPTFAWWEVDGQRQRRLLAESPLDERGAVWNPPTGGPLYFTRFGSGSRLDLLTPLQGPGMRVVARDAPPGDDPVSRVDLMTGTPERALLAVQTYPSTMIWRAEDLSHGGFGLVHESTATSYPEPTLGSQVHEPTVVGGRIHVMTPQGVVVSDDDGRTWTEITKWR